MANRLFNNPLVILENVAGSILDRRDVVLWEQPKIDTNAFTAGISDAVTDALGENIGGWVNSQLSDMIEQAALTELFTGRTIPYLSQINGFNMYGVSYISANIKPTSDICEHPLESGAKIADYAIIEPLRATVRIVMPTHRYAQIYNQITELYQKKTYIILQTKYGFFKNMVLVSMPHTLDYKDVDRTPIDLELQQVLEVFPTYISDNSVSINADQAINPSDSDTQDRGLANTTENTFESLQAIGLS